MSDSNLSRALAEVERVNAGAGDDALTLGVLTPLTGPGDPVAGELIVRGACVGVEYVREHSGRQFRLVVENDQATAAEEGMQRSAVAGLAKLAMADEVLALLGQWHLRTAGVVVETAERLGVPIFVENGHSTITAERRRTLFRTYFTIADRMPLLLRFLAEQGLRRVAVLAPNTVFGLMMADTLEEQAPAHGEFELLRFDFDQETTTTVRPQLEEVRDWQPDVVVNCGVVRTNYMVLNEAAEVGLRPDPPMVVTFPFPLRSDDYWRLAGEHVNHGHDRDATGLHVRRWIRRQVHAAGDDDGHVPMARMAETVPITSAPAPRTPPTSEPPPLVTSLVRRSWMWYLTLSWPSCELRFCRSCM